MTFSDIHTRTGGNKCNLKSALERMSVTCGHGNNSAIKFVQRRKGCCTWPDFRLNATGVVEAAALKANVVVADLLACEL